MNLNMATKALVILFLLLLLAPCATGKSGCWWGNQYISDECFDELGERTK